LRMPCAMRETSRSARPFQRQRYKAQNRSDSLESHVNVLKCLLVRQFTNLTGNDQIKIQLFLYECQINTKCSVYDSLPKVTRTGCHLLHLPLLKTNHVSYMCTTMCACTNAKSKGNALFTIAGQKSQTQPAFVECSLHARYKGTSMCGCILMIYCATRRFMHVDQSNAAII
jgi:hypothetical protein